MTDHSASKTIAPFSRSKDLVEPKHRLLARSTDALWVTNGSFRWVETTIARVANR